MKYQHSQLLFHAEKADLIPGGGPQRCEKIRFIVKNIDNNNTDGTITTFPAATDNTTRTINTATVAITATAIIFLL